MCVCGRVVGSPGGCSDSLNVDHAREETHTCWVDGIGPEGQPPRRRKPEERVCVKKHETEKGGGEMGPKNREGILVCSQVQTTPKVCSVAGSFNRCLDLGHL